MKCTKCSYTSFDFHQTCPKCGKDLSAEVEKLHLPSYEPTPPYLLASLTGEMDRGQYSHGNETSDVSPFPENQNQEILMLDENGLDSSEDLEESPLNAGENELMVALDELSFEYEPTTGNGSETPKRLREESLSMPELSLEDETVSTESELFGVPIMEDTPPFAPIDGEAKTSGLFGKNEKPGTTETSEGYLDLDLPEINQTDDQSEEEELLMSLDDLTFDKEPVSSKDFLDRKSTDENALFASEVLNFDKKTSPGPTEGPHDYFKLDLSDVDQAADRTEDPDDILFTPGMPDPEKISSKSPTELPDLPSSREERRTTEIRKKDKKKADLKDDFIDLDFLETEEDKKDS